MNPVLARKPLNSTTQRSFRLIGELINNSFARARKAWNNRDVEAYQQLAALQTKMGADFLTVNLDGTQKLRVRPEEMIEFAPQVISVCPMPITSNLEMAEKLYILAVLAPI